MRQMGLVHNMETRSALRAGLCGGGLAVFCDFDHPYTVLYQIVFQTAPIPGRILHPLILVVTCLFVCCLIAFGARLYFRCILGRSK